MECFLLIAFLTEEMHSINARTRLVARLSLVES